MTDISSDTADPNPRGFRGAGPSDAPPRGHVSHRVDGNAVAGILSTMFATDPTLLVVECGSCHWSARLGEWVVEADCDAFIVRCRACTHTVWTVMRDGDAASLRIAGPVVINATGE